MYISGIDFPNEIIKAINEGNLVVFAGAGVSMGKPTLLPDFKTLTDSIAFGTGKHKEDDESCESFLGRLKHQNIDVNEIAAEKLSSMELRPNDMHKNIVELFPDISKLKIVTTNYDNMFEAVLEHNSVNNTKIYDAPALPLGNDIKGIVHIHGNVKEPQYMIITDEDFGRAYLSDGYVSRFLVRLFEKYTVLFVGYSYDDIVVTYLTRAITKEKVSKKYILTDKKSRRWDELGICPIYFETGRYDILNEAIHKLGVRINRGLVDWKSRLASIVSMPPTDLSVESEVDFCLQDESRARLLAEFVNGKEWLWWIQEKGVLKNLFDCTVQLNEIDLIWANWIITEFFGKNDVLIKKLIVKHNNTINEKFAKLIIDNIIYKEKILSNETLSEYIVLLNKFLKDEWEISLINEKVMNREMYSIGLDMFERLFSFDVILKDKFLPKNEEDVEFKHQIMGDRYQIKNAWKLYGKKYIDYNAIRILNFGRNYIESLHNCYVQVGMATKKNEPYEFQENPIEEGNQIYNRGEAIYTLSQALSEASKKIESSDKEYNRWYIKQCVKSESVLMRKIGLKLLRETSSFTKNQKIRIVINYIPIYAVWEKEQIYRLIADVFDDISDVNKNKILNMIEKGIDRNEKKIKAYEKYNWCVWLKEKCKENERVNKIIENVKKEYSYFKPRKNPELNFDFSGAKWSGSVSPITQEQMYNMKLDELISMLKTYNNEEWEGPSREGLLNTFANCIKEKYEWTDNVIDKLIKEVEFSSDIWEYLLRGLEKTNFTTEEMLQLIRKIKIDCLIQERTLEFSRLLEIILDSEYIKVNFSQYCEELLEILTYIREKRKEDEYLLECRIIDRCYNCTTGILTLSLLKMLSMDKSDSIPEKYRLLLEDMLSNDIGDKEQIICILVGQIAFLYSRNREWSKEKLFPYLTSNNVQEFKAAWEGIAWFSRRMYAELADDLIEVYLSTVTRINLLNGETRTGFVDLYTVLMVYVVENPILDFIPKLFEVAEEMDRKQFISSIENCLKNMDLEHKYKLWNLWLKKYWKNRIKNIPVAFEEYEKEEMLDWIFELEEVYPEIVEIITSDTAIEKVDGLFTHRLKDSDFGKKYPDETAKLFTFWLNSNTNFNYGIKDVKDIAETIECSDSNNQKLLTEALLKCGLH